MNDPKKNKIIFLNVPDMVTKLRRLCAMVQHHFQQKERILILVPSAEAASYVDQLLWKQPEEAFIPHVIAHAATKEPVVITMAKSNINQSKIVLNLCGECVAEPSAYTTVYELLDLTHPDKEAAAQKRLTAYQAMGLQPEVC